VSFKSMSRDDPLFHDLRALPPHVRWPAMVGRWFFGLCGAVGAIAFVVHLIVFYIAWRHAAPSPVSDQTYRIAEHGHSVYVSYAMHETIKILEIVMLSGLGVGVPGGLLVDALLKRRQRRTNSSQRLQ